MAKTKRGGPLYRFFRRHGWCQTYYAKASDGTPTVDRDSAKACCLMGAVACIEKTPFASWEIIETRLYARLNSAIKKENAISPSAFNDTIGMTKRKIMAFLLKHNL